MMVPIIPALNEDCVAIILSFVDAPTLVNVACTSRSAKAVALPILVRTVSLRMHNPPEIVSFCNSVLRNRLARHIKRLNILHDNSVVFGSVEGAMPSLVEVIASAENLACLRIPVCAGLLFQNAPTLRDSILIRPPSRSLELIGLTEWTWLTTRQFVGLRSLRLGLFLPATDPVSLFAFTATAASTLETMHLEGCGWLHFLSTRFTDGCAPCPKMRMLSLAHARILLTDLTHLGQAFPDLRFIRCDDLYLSRDGSLETLSASVASSSQVFLKLVAVDATLDVVELFATGHKLRVIWIHDYIHTMPELARLTTVLAWNSVRSLGLNVQLWVGQGPTDDDGIPIEHFFAEICRVAPRLKYLSLTMHLVPDVSGPISDRIAQREAQTSQFFAIAMRHLADLDDLYCLFITLITKGHESYAHGEAEFAASIAANLPRIKFLVLGPLSNSDDRKLCLERPEVATMRADGIINFVELKLDSEEVERRLDRYQFDISDASLDGVADWLASMRALDHVLQY